MSLGLEAGNLVTLQRAFFEKLGLREGDCSKFLDAMERFPFFLSCCSRECLGELAREAFEIREKLAAREEEIFGDVGKLFDALETGE